MGADYVRLLRLRIGRGLPFRRKIGKGQQFGSKSAVRSRDGELRRSEDPSGLFPINGEGQQDQGGLMSELRFFGRSLRSLVGILAALMFANSTLGTYLAENGRIAFSAKFTGTWQLFPLNPDGTELFQVTNLPPTENPFWFPDYSPDGRQ